MQKTWLILFLILILQLVLHLPFSGEPMIQDEASYFQISDRMARGEILYRDLIEIKPPGVFLFYRVLSHEPLLFRAQIALFSLLLTILVFFIGRRIGGDRTGLAAGGLFAVFSSGVFCEGTIATPDFFMLLPLLLALLSFLAGIDGEGQGGGNRGIFWAGIFSGLALLIKQTALFNLLALGLFLLLNGRSGEKSWNNRLVQLVHFSGGAMLGPLLLLGYYWSGGMLPDLCRSLYTYSLGTARPNLPMFLFRTGHLFLFENSVLWLLGLAGSVVIWRRWREAGSRLLVYWLFFALLGVYAAGLAQGHYYLPVIAALSLPAGLLLARWGESGWPRPLRGFFLLLLFFGALVIVASESEFYLGYTPEQISTARYGTDLNVRASRLGLRIKERTRPGDKVFGISSVIFYSGRSSLARYFLPVRAGRTEISWQGRLVYAHDFSFQRGPEVIKLVNDDIYRALADTRTKYACFHLADYYAPPDIGFKLREYGYILDRELSDRENGIAVFKRKWGE